MSDPQTHPRKMRFAAMSAIAALLAVFAVLSWTAVRTKSATADEPLHLMGGYMKLFHGDFRLNCEDPPLFAYWAMIPHNARTLQTPTDSPVWQHMMEYLWRQWQWCKLTLYETPGNDPDALLTRSRAMMLVLGIGLGATLAGFAWRLAGPVAAIAAVTLYCLDPNFLGHAPLVKNDVPLTLILLATALVIWSIGHGGCWWNLMLLAALCGVAANTKFSGVIVGPIAVATLLVRSQLARPWSIGPVSLGTRTAKVLAVVGIGAFCLGATVLITWACYGFRFAPTADPHARFRMDSIVQAAVIGMERRWKYTHDEPPSDQQLESFAHTPFIRAVQFADAHRLMPHAWLAGLLDTYATTRSRRNFLNGQIDVVGHWYYFPLAMLYKTPTATLAAAAGAVVVAMLLRRRRRQAPDALDHWSLACLLLPLAIYGYSVVTSDVNLGLRHAFAVYPFIYLLVGVACARAVRAWPRAAGAGGAILAAGLAIETLVAHPDYIAFFNAPVGGAAGGIERLGDSNLDWGQDLLLLQKWQQAHPDVKLYASYFGMASPSYYLRYTPIPGDAGADGDVDLPHEPGVAAISATNLQGIYLLSDDPVRRARFIVLRHTQRPIEVLGGTIYLFEVAPGSPLLVPKP